MDTSSNGLVQTEVSGSVGAEHNNIKEAYFPMKTVFKRLIYQKQM